MVKRGGVVGESVRRRERERERVRERDKRRGERENREGFSNQPKCLFTTTTVYTRCLNRPELLSPSLMSI